MGVVTIDEPTECVMIDGKKVFPLGLSNPSPLSGKTPSGNDAWSEVAGAGANFVRSAQVDWSLQQIEAQIAAQAAWIHAAEGERPAGNGTNVALDVASNVATRQALEECARGPFYLTHA